MRVPVDDGVHLEVVTAGDPGLPALVLVHGFGGAKEDFTDHLDALSATHHVVVFDHRGHGASGKPDREAAYSLDRMAADVVAVADALGIVGFRLLGNSMGGMVAERVVLAHPERVEALILQDTWPGPPPFDRGSAVKAAHVARTRGLGELKQRMEGLDPVSTAAHDRLLRERPGYREFGDRKFLSQSSAMYAAIVVEMLHQDDLSERLRAVRCPTLVLVGEQDPARPGCARLAEVIPGARLAVVPDAGHSPQFESPAAWLEVLTTFLGELGR